MRAIAIATPSSPATGTRCARSSRPASCSRTAARRRSCAATSRPGSRRWSSPGSRGFGSRSADRDDRRAGGARSPALVRKARRRCIRVRTRARAHRELRTARSARQSSSIPTIAPPRSRKRRRASWPRRARRLAGRRRSRRSCLHSPAPRLGRAPRGAGARRRVPRSPQAGFRRACGRGVDRLAARPRRTRAGSGGGRAPNARLQSTRSRGGRSNVRDEHGRAVRELLRRAAGERWRAGSALRGVRSGGRGTRGRVFRRASRGTRSRT